MLTKLNIGDIFVINLNLRIFLLSDQNVNSNIYNPKIYDPTLLLRKGYQ